MPAEFTVREFVCYPDGIVLVEGEISFAVSAAYDILTDAGYSPEKAAEVAYKAEQAGHNPEAIARKMIRLRDAMRS